MNQPAHKEPEACRQPVGMMEEAATEAKAVSVTRQNTCGEYDTIVGIDYMYIYIYIYILVGGRYYIYI